jgi:sulfite exporter TauE/SafE
MTRRDYGMIMMASGAGGMALCIYQVVGDFWYGRDILVPVIRLAIYTPALIFIAVGARMRWGRTPGARMKHRFRGCLGIAAGSFLIVLGVYQIVTHVLPDGDVKALFMILAGVVAIWIGVRLWRGRAE